VRAPRSVRCGLTVASRAAATGSVGVPIAAGVGAMLMPFPILGDAGGAATPLPGPVLCASGGTAQTIPGTRLAAEHPASTRTRPARPRRPGEHGARQCRALNPSQG
jgi:hypothetical protein